MLSRPMRNMRYALALCCCALRLGWAGEAKPELTVQSGHGGGVSGAAVTPDGRFLATGGSDDVLLWDLKTGRQVRAYHGALGPGKSKVAISPDGRRLFAASDHTGILMWDLASGTLERTFKDLMFRSTFILSPDGRTLVTAEYEARGPEMLVVWDVESGRRLRSFKASKEHLRSLVMSPDGRMLAAGGWEKKVRLWDPSSGRHLDALKGLSEGNKGLALSPDGRLLAAAATEGLAIWDLTQDGRLIALYTPDTAGKTIAKGLGFGDALSLASGATSVLFSQDGRRLWIGGYGGSIRVLDVSAWKLGPSFTAHSHQIEDLTLTPDGKTLITAGGDTAARAWDPETGREAATFTGKTSQFGAAAAATDGRTLAVGHHDGGISLWDLKEGVLRRRLQSPESPIVALAISADGGRVLTTSYRHGKDAANVARLWDTAAGASLAEFLGHSKLIHNAAIRPDGRQAATGDDRRGFIWDEGGKVVQSFPITETLGWIQFGRVVAEAFGAPQRPQFDFQGSGSSCLVVDRASKKELARLYTLTDGWAVVTPEGFFDGSPEGLKELRWTLGLESSPLEAFSEGFYVPGLLSKVMAGETPSRTGGGDLTKTFAQRPVVRITSPKSGDTLAEETVAIEVTALDQGGGVDEIRLYHNGAAVGSGTRGMKAAAQGAEKSQTFQVELVEGANLFKAVALSRDRAESNPDEVSVTLTGIQQTSNLHVLAVGINDYKNSALNLNFARPDAQAILDYFKPAGNRLFSEVKPHALMDAAATKAAIVAELKALRGAQPQDVVVIYLSGHGDSLGDVWYFVPHELAYPEREEDVKAKGLSSLELLELIKAIPATKKIILMDACKSGGALVAFRGLEDRKALKNLARASGVFMVSASSKDQLASEVKDLGHGLFTYILLEGLKGQADGSPKDGVVKVLELVGFVEDQLPELSKKYRTQSQFPIVHHEGMDFPITTLK